MPDQTGLSTPPQQPPSKVIPAIRKHFALGFLPDAARVPLALGKPSKSSAARIRWDLVTWGLLAVGIFIRQGMVLPALDWKIQRLTLGSFLASAAISLAILPMFMRWVNRKRAKPGLAHVATPFAFGFFLDLTRVSVLTLIHL